MKILKIGILGGANIAQRYVLPALELLQSKFKIMGIASRRVETAKEISVKYNCTLFNEYESLIKKGNLDIVYISLPNALHYEWIIKALDNSIHVLSEKSLTCSLKETKQIINRAKEKNLAVVENFQFRFHSQMKYILDLMRDNIIGELRCVRSSFGFPPFEDEDNIRYQKKLGGGALLDTGVYPIKLSQLILGEDISVKSARLFFDDKLNVDIWGGAFLADNKSSLFSEIAFGFDNYYQCNLELWGSKGKITADRIFTASPGFQPSITIETYQNKETKLLPEDNHFVNMLNYVYELIINGNFEEEYKQNINQSRLLEEVKRQAEK